MFAHHVSFHIAKITEAAVNQYLFIGRMRRGFFGQRRFPMIILIPKTSSNFNRPFLRLPYPTFLLTRQHPNS